MLKLDIKAWWIAWFVLGFLGNSHGLLAAENRVQFFTRHYASRGNYRDLPAPGETLKNLSVACARGEYEPTVLLLRASLPLKEVAVELKDDLRCGQTSIPKANVEVRVAVDMKRWLDPRRYERIPYLLMKKRRFDIKADQTERVWITVHVPEDAAPGKYVSQIGVSAGGRMLGTFRYEVEVWPFRLNEVDPAKINNFMYFRPQLSPEWMRNPDYLAACFRDMKEHGMTGVTGYIYPSPTGDILTSVSGKTEWPNLKDELGAIKAGGMMRKGAKFIWLGASCYIDRCKPFGELVDATGMEAVFYGQDEPGDEARCEAQRKITAAFRKAHPSGKLCTAIGDEGIKKVGDCLDIWICSAMELSDARKAEADKQGKVLWSYDCAIAPTDPLTVRHYFGFLVWRVNAAGAALWEYCEHSASNRFGMEVKRERDAQEVLKAWNPDWEMNFDFVFFTPEDGPIPSVGWEGVREGVDDYRYLLTLEDRIAHGPPDAKAVRKARDLLQELRQKIDPLNYGKVYQAGKNQGKPRGDLFDRPLPEPSLQPENYDEYRRRIAQCIIELSK